MNRNKLIATILLFVVLYALFALVLMWVWNLTFVNLMGATPMPYTTALACTGLAWLAKISLLV